MNLVTLASSFRNCLLQSAALAGLIFPVSAQPVSGTFLGFLPDGLARQIRPLSGIVGATSLGKPAPFPGEAAALVMAPGGSYGMFLSAPTSAASLWFPATGTIQSIPSIDPGATQIVFSPTSSAVALYFASDHSVEVVSGLPLNPGAPRKFVLTPFAPTKRQFAVSDDGNLLLSEEGGSNGQSSGSAVVLSPAGEQNRLSLTGAVTALAFAPASHNALVVSDREALFLPDSGSLAAQTITIDGVAGATSAAFSADRKSAYFVRRGSTQVTIADLASSGIPSVTLDCHHRLDLLYRLGASETYLLNQYLGAPIRILDGKAKPPRIVIAPPALDSDRLP